MEEIERGGVGVRRAVGVVCAIGVALCSGVSREGHGGCLEGAEGMGEKNEWIEEDPFAGVYIPECFQDSSIVWGLLGEIWRDYEWREGEREVDVLREGEMQGEEEEGEEEKEEEKEEKEGPLELHLRRERRRRRREDQKNMKKKWNIPVPRSVLKGATVEDVERVIVANKQALESISEEYRAELEGRTECRINSLEWLEALRKVLKKSLEDLKRRRGEKEGKDEAEIEKVIELVEKAIVGYEAELKDRRKYLRERVNKWLRLYSCAFNQCLENKEDVTKAIRKGEDAAKKAMITAMIRQKRSRRGAVNGKVYMVVVRGIEKGLEDLARGRPIEDIRRSPCVVYRIYKARECKGVRRDGGNEKKEHSLYHVKNTFFFVATSAIHFDISRKCYFRKASKEERVQDVPSPFLQQIGELKERLGKISCRADIFLNVCFLYDGAGEGIERLRREGERVRDRVALEMEELDVVEEVYRLICRKECAGEYEGERVETLLTEMIESYVKEKGERGDGDLERVLRAFYRVMKRSGHGECAGEKREDGSCRIASLRDYKVARVAKWLKAVAEEVGVMGGRNWSVA